MQTVACFDLISTAMVTHSDQRKIKGRKDLFWFLSSEEFHFISSWISRVETHCRIEHLVSWWPGRKDRGMGECGVGDTTFNNMSMF